jgi:Domain of unknown function (DUF4185)
MNPDRSEVKQRSRLSFLVQVLVVFTLMVSVSSWQEVLNASNLVSGSKSKPIPVDVKFDPHVVRVGHGDNFNHTWAADDNIYTNVDDGLGWQEPPASDFNCSVARLTGDPDSITGQFLPNYPKFLRNRKRVLEPELLATYDKYAKFYKHWYGFGIISVDGVLYHFISHTNRSFESKPWLGTKLVYSPDLGETWYRHDNKQSHMDFLSNGGMFFWHETEDYSFSQISFLQCGKDNSLAKDNYVYLYSKVGSFKPTEIVLARVLKDKILDKSSYRYFKEYDSAGYPVWTPDVEKKGIIMHMPQGYLPFGWLPSVVYNPGLDLYIMVAGARGRDGTDRWQHPASLSMWYAEYPWGPFKQFYFDMEWTSSDPAGRLYQPKLCPKWISEDGTEMYLIFSDCQDQWKKYYNWNQQKITFILSD